MYEYTDAAFDLEYRIGHATDALAVLDAEFEFQEALA